MASEAVMVKRIGRLMAISFLLAAAGGIATGCAPVFPREVTDRIDRHISFQQLQSNPEKFKGTWLMLGGVIVSVKNMKEGTLLEILQKPLDSDGRPLETDRTFGRFLVDSDQFLDSAVYRLDRRITVVGKVIGQKTLPLDEITYQYPLLSAETLHLWSPASSPHFFFGIGVSGRM
jgi:outer membrane lipoprotein